MDDVPHIRLDHFLTRAGAVDTGGRAKVAVQSGAVQVNGEIETRRRRKLLDGDVVAYGDDEWLVTFSAEPE